MARIRTVKPELFRHEGLFEAEVATGLPLRLSFIGLFTCCDREGRFKWRPRELKIDVLPYDSVDFIDVLEALQSHGFIIRYRHQGKDYGCIPTFTSHQVINNREQQSILPSPDDADESGISEKSQAKPNQACFIYVAVCREASRIKIGFSENDPASRIRDLNCGSPFDLELCDYIEAPQETETQIHHALSAHRIKGEWFELNDMVSRILDAYFTRAPRVSDASKCRDNLVDNAPYSRVDHATEGKGREGKGTGRELEGKENSRHASVSDPDAPRLTDDGQYPNELREVFDYWRHVMEKTDQTKFTDNRKKKIRARLREGYTVEAIKTAIDNCRRSGFHMGANDQGTIYNDLTLICRNGEQLEFFCNRVAQNAPSSGRNPETLDEFSRRNQEQAERVMNSGLLDDLPDEREH